MSSLLRIADDRSQWAAITAEGSVEVPQRRMGITGISVLARAKKNLNMHSKLLVTS